MNMDAGTMAEESPFFKERFSTSSLELAYDKFSFCTQLTLESEEKRKLRLRLLLLEFERDEVYAKDAVNVDIFETLENTKKQLQNSLIMTQVDLQKAQQDIEIKIHETSTLQAEVHNLQRASAEFSQLSAEKLALARELEVLKPEVSYLRSQAASYQTLLSEKVSLQQQVDFLLTKVEAEKRTIQNLKAEKEKQQPKDANLDDELKHLHGQVLKKGDRCEKLKQEVQKRLANQNFRLVTMKSKLDTSRPQSYIRGEQPKETLTKLQNTKIASNTRFHYWSNPAAENHSMQKSHDQSSSHLGDDTVIGTPGDFQSKKAKRDTFSVIGDKSTFPITPFLNRPSKTVPWNTIEESSLDGQLSKKAVIPRDALSNGREHDKEGLTDTLYNSKPSEKPAENAPINKSESFTAKKTKRLISISSAAQNPQILRQRRKP